MDEDYALFVTVVEAGSLSAAGRALGLSPAMVSKRMARLEERLGVRLAHRTTRRLATTAAGQIFYEDIVRVLAAAREAESRVAGGVEPAGRLRVTAPTSFGRMHIAPHLGGLLTAYPRLDLELDLTDGFTDLIGERYDLAVRIAPEPDAQFVGHRLAGNRRVLCAAPAYLADHAIIDRLDGLAQHRLLAAIGQMPWRIEGPDGISQIEGRSAVLTNSSEVVRELAVSGVGIALRSIWDVSAELRDGRLVRILPDYEGATDVSIYAVHPRATLVPAAVGAFVDYFTGIFAPVPPWERGIANNALV